MEVEKLDSFVPGDPTEQDVFRMATLIGRNVWIMYERHKADTHDYIIVVNPQNGERLKIIL